MTDRRAESLSIYFYTGDFEEAFARFEQGEEQGYATHDEIGRLIHDLIERGVAVRIYSFISNAYKVVERRPGLTFVSLGGQRYADSDVLRRAVADDPSAAIIPHFPNPDLLSAVIRSGKRSMAFLASSFYRKGLRAPFQKWLLARRLNSSAFDLVSNHCLPATRHLARLGVNRRKLIPWDVPHRYHPGDHSAKSLRSGRLKRIAYAGTINEDKGVGDLIRAIAILHDRLPVECVIAGSGSVDAMRHLAGQIGVETAVSFVGQVPNNQVFQFFGNADLVVVPSRPEFPEGFPLTMFEAIASRTPIVCSDHPIFVEIMEDRINAMLFTAGDPRSLADVIEAALVDPALYSSLSHNATSTWEKLEGPADWRKLIEEWFFETTSSPWIHERTLFHAE